MVIEEDPEVNLLVGALVNMVAKGQLTGVAQGWVDQGMITAAEATQFVSGAMVAVKVLAKLQTLKATPKA